MGVGPYKDKPEKGETMRAPQIIMIVLLSLEFAIGISNHGKAREEKYNAGVTLASIGILAGILIWGGFFK
jgi:hypothetical protein